MHRCGLSPVFVYYMRRWQFVKGANGEVLPFDPANWSGVGLRLGASGKSNAKPKAHVEREMREIMR